MFRRPAEIIQYHEPSKRRNSRRSSIFRSKKFLGLVVLLVCLAVLGLYVVKRSPPSLQSSMKDGGLDRDDDSQNGKAKGLEPMSTGSKDESPVDSSSTESQSIFEPSVDFQSSAANDGNVSSVANAVSEGEVAQEHPESDVFEEDIENRDSDTSTSSYDMVEQ